MRRHARATFSRSKLRKPSGQGSPPPGRLRLAILAAAVAAFFLVPVAHAAASGLKVNVAGTGKGEVKTNFFYDGTEPPIECSGPPATGTCESPVDPEFNMLAAIPAPGSVFAGWTIGTGSPVAFCDGSEEEVEVAESWSTEEPFAGAGFAGTEGDCAIEAVGGSIELTATFNKAFTVEKVGGEGTVTGKESGMICGPSKASCSVAYTGPETLTASPAAGYAFSKWKGCTLATGLKCEIAAVTSTTKVIAYFIPTSSLKVTKAGSGSGTVKATGISCDENCSEAKSAVQTGKVVKVSTKPAKSSEAAVLSGGTGTAAVCNGASACEFVIEAGQTLTATFAPIPTKTLTVNLTGSGAYKGKVSGKGIAKGLLSSKVSCASGCTTQTESFLETDTVTLEAAAGTGYSFEGWSGAGCSGKGTCVVSTSSDKTVSAEFK